MASAQNVFNRIGSDLSFTVSYAIASELRDSAKDAGVHQDELIAMVFVIYLVLLYLPMQLIAIQRLFDRQLGLLWKSVWSMCASAPRSTAAQKQGEKDVANKDLTSSADALSRSQHREAV